MAPSSSDSAPDAPAIAPWEIKRDPSGKHLLRRSVPWIGVILLAALILWGLWPKPIVIETAAASRGPLTVRLSEEGKTRVRNRYIVAAPLAGKMRRVMLKPGDAVKADETILTVIEPAATPLLDPRLRTQTEASIATRQAARQLAAETLTARHTALTLAETDRDRLRSINRSGSVSQAERDRVEGDASLRASEVRAAEFSLQVADYELAQARAALARPAADTSSNLVEIKSPLSGRVLRVLQESEMPITPGTAILEIGDPTDIEIEAEILSRDAVTIHPGDAVEVEQWGGEAPLTGRVRRIEPAAFTKVSALGVEEQRVIVLSDLINPPEATKALGDRFRVEVHIAIWHSDEVLKVPAGALFREGNSWKTYLFRDGKAQLTDLQVGHSDGRFTEILTGLQPGDEVLLHPPDTLKDGGAVRKKM
jgi:HlyD family secretion protein